MLQLGLELIIADRAILILPVSSQKIALMPSSGWGGTGLTQYGWQLEITPRKPEGKLVFFDFVLWFPPFIHGDSALALHKTRALVNTP